MDRPREKLAKKGAKSLSDFELIKAIIGSGNSQADVSTIAKDVQELLTSGRSNLTYENLANIKGLGSAKISEILAAIELTSRFSDDHDQPIVNSPEDVVEIVKDIRDKQQEYFVCLTLDGANRLISKRVITIGTLTASLVHPREVFADAITDRAASIIVIHNHPSRNLKPSTADLEITQRLKGSAKLLGINLIDHIIVTYDDFSSVYHHDDHR